MNIILNYFWGIGIIFAAVNTVVLKMRLPKTETEDENQEQKNVSIFYFILLCLPCILLQIFQILGNYHSPLYLFYRDFSNVFYWLGLCSVFFTYILIIVSIIKFRNIDKYSKYLFKTELKRNQLILVMIGIIIFNILILFGFSSFMDIKGSLEKIT